MRRLIFAPVFQLLFLAGALLLPFLQRPLFVDDHAHFRQALAWGRHAEPLYRGGPATLGWTPGQGPGEANGPIYFHLFGWFTAHAGSELWKSHLLMGLITLLGVFALYGLAQEYRAFPVWAGFLWLSSPHAWITANSLLADALLGPLCLLGLYGWTAGWRRNSPFLLGLGALALAAAPLVKYTGLLIWFVAAAWVLLEANEKRTWRWLWALVPIAAFVAWLMLNQQTYGESHFLAVARAKMTWPALSHVVILAIFAAATTPICWVITAAGLFSGTRSRRWACAGLLVASTFVGASFSPHLWGLQLGFWFGVFATWVFTLGRVITRREAGLVAWAVIGLSGLVIAIPWVCERYLVIVGPALVLLSLKGLERLTPAWVGSPARRLAIAGLLTLASGLIVQADYRLAQADSEAASWAETLRGREFPTHRGYFPSATLGSLGYYLELQGWQPLEPGSAVPSGGVLAITPRTLAPRFWPSLTKPHLVAQKDVRTLNPVRILDRRSGAGFYGSIWGPLPYSFSNEPIETYTLLLQP